MVKAPLVAAGCFGLAACTTASPPSAQAVRPALASPAPVQLDGTAEDGARSLAQEVENNGKPALKKAKTTAEQQAALEPQAATEQQVAQNGAIEVAEAAFNADDKASAKPAGLAVQAEKKRERAVQVASLDPTAGLNSTRFGDEAPAIEATEARVDPTSGVEHSKPAPSGRIGPERVEARSSELDRLISHYSDYYGVPEKLVRRVAHRESTMNPRARNGIYMGLMQISPATARGMGYRGAPSGLLDAETNLKYAVRYLRGAYVVARGNADKADRLYQSGYYYHAKRMGLLDETGVGVDRKRRGRRG